MEKLFRFKSPEHHHDFANAKSDVDINSKIAQVLPETAVFAAEVTARGNVVALTDMYCNGEQFLEEGDVLFYEEEANDFLDVIVDRKINTVDAVNWMHSNNIEGITSYAHMKLSYYLSIERANITKQIQDLQRRMCELDELEADNG